MRIRNASSTNFGSTTRQFRSGTGSSTSYQRKNGSTTTNTSATATALIRVPVIIGIQNDTQTEIVSGLREGESVVTKKIISTGGSTAAPSVTSL
ncbi:MAG: hypothetical protein WCH11_04200, partial [Bdellovibrio sp.]